MCLPEIRTALRQIEHLPRIEQPLEFLHQFDALVAATLRIDEDQHRRHAGRWYRFDDERARFLGDCSVVRFCGRRILGLAAFGAVLFGARLFAQRRLEAAAARQFDDPRRWHDDVGVRAERAFLADALRIEARLLVVVGVLAPGARERHDLLRAERELRLQGLRGCGRSLRVFLTTLIMIFE